MRSMLLVIVMALAVFGLGVSPSEAKQRGQGKTGHRVHHTKSTHHVKSVHHVRKNGKHGKNKARKVAHHRSNTTVDSGTTSSL